MDGAAAILVVEDEALVARELEHGLSALGYLIAGTAASAEEAVQCATERRPDLVLMDVRIRGPLDGIETAAVLRERFGVPVIYLTAFADQTTIDRAKRTEPHGYLVKPIRSGELRRAVEMALHKHEVEGLRRQLELRDRLASLGAMAAGVAHEVNNPLAFVLANLQFGREALDDVRAEAAGEALPADLQGRLAAIDAALADGEHGAHRVQRIVADLKDFARSPAPEGAPVDVCRALRWSLQIVGHELRHRARVITSFGAAPLVDADEARLGQVFVNILINAAHAITSGDVEHNEVRVTTTTDPQGRAVAEVRDTGAGMTAEVRQRIFEPFFTTKPVGGGTGLGLSISYNIVASFGGALEVESAPGRGTVFRVVLPASPAPGAGAEAARPERGPARPGGGAAPQRARILVIDDEPLIARVVRRVLESEHELAFRETAAAALAMIDGGARFDAILCDLMMPEMTGMELYATLEARHPDQARRVIFLTGGAFTPVAREFLAGMPGRFLEKPFQVEALRRAVRAAIALPAG